MWNIEDTENGKDLVWSQPELGIGPSALKGTANLQNVNIATEPGQVMASFDRVNQAQQAISDGTLTPDGATLFDAPSELFSGAWIKVTASTVSGITAATNPTTFSFDYLAIGGGGGGGVARDTIGGGGGGGGAGEFTTGSDTFAVGTHLITVGAGGDGGTDQTAAAGDNGEDTIIAGVVTAVGGGGGGEAFLSNQGDGLAGASGGGGGANGSGGTSGGTATAGNDGGDTPASAQAGGGGGGSSTAGDDSVSDVGGNGGNGTASSITGTSITYAAGGGGGGGDAGGDGGTGGGGKGGFGSGTGHGEDGEVNTGSGGGGAGNQDETTKTGGDGGTGVVVLSYPTGTAHCIGGAISYTSTNTVHTFTENGVFEVLWINPGGLYYVSFKDDSDQIKLSEMYDPYGDNPITTHGTTGTVTFDTLTTVGQPIAKATEKYKTNTGEEYRYYILDANSYVWVYDTLVYETTLTANNVGVEWMLAEPNDYANEQIRGMNVLNGWLFFITTTRILCKPTVTLGLGASFMARGYLTNPYPNHPNYAYVGSQGTLLYTDGVYIGEIYPTTSLITSIANLQSYASYTASTTTATISTLIGGSIPAPINDSRLPVVFFTEQGGVLPTAITPNFVYYIEYDLVTNTFEVYEDLTSGSAVDVETGASGTQYFNTFWPVGSDAGHGGTNPTLQFTSQRVNLPFYETAQRLLEVDNQILIGCKGNVVYPWNQVDSVPSNVITLPEADVKTMINVNNMAYIFAGDKGNIYITNGLVASLVLKIPDYTAGVPGTPYSYIEPTFTWGDAIFCRGRVYASILDQTATKAGNCGGVWSFIPSENVDPSQDVGSALRLENQNSYGDYSGYAPILINVIEQEGKSPKYWAAWQDSYDTASAAFGIDYSTEVPVTTYAVETDLIPTGTFLDKETFEQLEYKLTVPLAAGDSIQLYWRTDPTGAWQTAGDVRSEDNYPVSGWYEVNFEKTQWVQVRAEITTGGTTSSSFVPLKEIRLR